MPYEIERKFLVNPAKWREIINDKELYKSLVYSRHEVLQGYICLDKERTVRIRLLDDLGYFTVKGKNVGATRLEYEYPISFTDAKEMLENICHKPLIEKTRFVIKHEKVTWVVDDFFGQNAGLLLAEVELPSEETLFVLPDWVTTEVTDDPRYFNSNLVKNPYTTWQNAK